MSDQADLIETSPLSGYSRAQTVLAGASLIAVLVPMGVVLLTRWGVAYLPIQDLAVFNLRLRDLLTDDTPLVGVYSQFGWNHPGPAAYWLLAPFLALSSGAPWGLIVGSAVVHAGTVSLTIWIAWRTSGPLWATGWATVIAASYVAVGPWMVLEAWNPHLAFPLVLLLLLLAWRCTTEPGSYFPWVVVTSSLLAQVHIGYVPIVGAVGAWVVLVMWRAFRSGSSAVDRTSTLRWSAAAVAVLWAAPAIEALLNGGGNVRALGSYFVLGSGQEQRAGLTAALELTAAQFALPPPWLGGPSDLDPTTGLAIGTSVWWLLVVVALVGAGVLMHQRCALANRRLIELSWVVSVVGVASLAVLRGKIAPYLFYWRIPFAVLLVAAVVAGAWNISALSTTRRPKLVGQTLLTAFVIIVSAGFAADLWRAPDHVMRFEPATEQLLEQIGSLPGPVIVRWAGSPLGGVHAGIVNELARRGEPVGVDDGGGFKWGERREIPRQEAVEIWYVSEQGLATSALKSLPDSRVVAEVSPLSPADEAELSRLQSRAAAAAAAAGHPEVIPKLDSPLAVFDIDEFDLLPDSDLRRFEALTTRAAGRIGCRCAVIAVPANTTPTDAFFEYVEGF